MYAAIAQLVEQGTENPCVLGSIPSCGIFFCPYFSRVSTKTGIVQKYIQNINVVEMS